MAYAVIKTGGKQYRVTAGDKIDVEKLDLAVDTETTFDEVLMVNDGSSIRIGSPIVDGATVSAKVVDQFRGPKGVAFKFKDAKAITKPKDFAVTSRNWRLPESTDKLCTPLKLSILPLSPHGT